jgi:hypothetical protein
VNFPYHRKWQVDQRIHVKHVPPTHQLMEEEDRIKHRIKTSRGWWRSRGGRCTNVWSKVAPILIVTIVVEKGIHPIIHRGYLNLWRGWWDGRPRWLTTGLIVKSLHCISHFLILLPFILLSNFNVSLSFAHTKEHTDQFVKRWRVFFVFLPRAIKPPLGGGWTTPGSYASQLRGASLSS